MKKSVFVCHSSFTHSLLLDVLLSFRAVFSAFYFSGEVRSNKTLMLIVHPTPTASETVTCAVEFVVDVRITHGCQRTLECIASCLVNLLFSESIRE